MSYSQLIQSRVTQLGECQVYTLDVAGSIPVPTTIFEVKASAVAGKER